MTPEEINELKVCYETLGVPLHASAEEIQTAYRQLAQRWRPDANETATGSESEGADNQMRVLNDAYERVKGAPLRYHVPYKGEGTSGRWSLPREPSENFVRANLLLSEAAPSRSNTWYRRWRRLKNEPLACALLVLGVFQLVFGLAGALSWEMAGLSWGESIMALEATPALLVRLISSGLLGSIGAAAVVAMPRFKLWLVLSLALAQGLIVNHPQFWLFFGVVSAVAIALQFVAEIYRE